MRVLVTGATGFLGRHVVSALLGRGHCVRAMVRPATDTSQLPWGPEVELFQADLRGGRDLQPAFEQVDALVHLAAVVAGDDDQRLLVGMRGTERLLQAMTPSAVKRIVLASSFSVYDWSRVRRVLTESTPLLERPYDRDGYAVAKWWQERLTRRMAAEQGVSLVVLRPGFIWGEGNEDIPGAGHAMGRLYFVIGPRKRLPLTYVENCADVFARAVELDANTEVPVTMNVVDDQLPRTTAYVRAQHRAMGLKKLRIPVPYHLAYGITRMARFTSRVIFRGKGKLPSILIPQRFEARFKPVNFSNQRLCSSLNWQPPVRYDEALDRTFQSSTAALTRVRSDTN